MTVQVLPAVYLFIGKSLHATPAQLGTLTLCRALVQVGCKHSQESLLVLALVSEKARTNTLSVSRYMSSSEIYGIAA